MGREGYPSPRHCIKSLILLNFKWPSLATSFITKQILLLQRKHAT
jgi:hypothetical protein